MDNIDFKVDPDSKKEVDSNILFRLVPPGSGLGDSVYVNIGCEAYAVCVYTQFLNAGLVDAYLYILANTEYHKYVLISRKQHDNTFHVYKITEDDNTTDNNIQNLDRE